MPIPLRNSFKIMISDSRTWVRAASDDGSALVGNQMGVIGTPGMIVQRFRAAGGENKWKPQDSTDADSERAVLLDKPEQVDNTGIEDTVAVNEDAEVAVLLGGAQWNAIVITGIVVRNGTLLQNNGDGKLKLASTGDVWIRAEQDLGSGATSGDTRCVVNQIF